MRARFLAAAGPPGLIDRLAEQHHWPEALPRGWKTRLRLPGLLILARAEDPSLVFAGGAVLGTLFRRVDAQRVTLATPELEEEIERTAGQALVDNHWGAWFAIFARPEGHWALRDPSAFAPAYHRAESGLDLYFSDFRAALDLGMEPGRPDLDFLRHWVSFPHLRTQRTGLHGIKELLPGTRREVKGASVALTPAWSPWQFAAPAATMSQFETAAETLRREILNVVAAQGRGRGELLLELSGGLDSSIIAAALRAGKVPFRSVNFVTKSAEGDERRYARAVADATSDRHFQIEEIDAPLDFGLPEQQRLRPGLSIAMAPIHSQFAAHGEAIGAETFLTGAGGDNVFCYLTTAAPVLDAWQELGPGAAFTTLQDVSELCGCTAWTTARFAVRKAWRTPSRWRRDTEFLEAGAAPLSPEPHPWLEAPSGAAPGKREHIAALLRIQHVVDPETRLSSLPFLHPLIAQPLLELCLCIPTWLWVRHGHNRAVARDAFRGLLPEEVLARHSKGRLEAMCMRAYRRHRLDIAELLLGGRLRETGLLDPDSVEAYLEREGPPADALHFRLFELATAELWLRSVWR